jgi:hypothetical protein
MDHEEGVGGRDSALPVREAQSVVSQTETLNENIDRSKCNVSDQSTQTAQGPSQAEAQIRAYFLTIAETSLA